jgi:hypothetical protein
VGDFCFRRHVDVSIVYLQQLRPQAHPVLPGARQVTSDTFWNEHPPLQATQVVINIMGGTLAGTRFHFYENVHGHQMILVPYSPGFVMTADAKKKMRDVLEQMDWLFITKREPDQGNPDHFLHFGIAPILRKQVTVAYHATRTCLIEKIMTEGLLPSNQERRSTDFPDTEGVIHICTKLRHRGGENDSAEWWANHLSKSEHTLCRDPNWTILQIDMALVPTARAYQDMHSKSGLIVDRIARIPPEALTKIG